MTSTKPTSQNRLREIGKLKTSTQDLWHVPKGTRNPSSDRNMPQPPDRPRSWDEIGSKATFEWLLEEVPDVINKARAWRSVRTSKDDRAAREHIGDEIWNTWCETVSSKMFDGYENRELKAYLSAVAVQRLRALKPKGIKFDTDRSQIFAPKGRSALESGGIGPVRTISNSIIIVRQTLSPGEGRGPVTSPDPPLTC
ncbi:hypothetical protein EVAR_51685_1 [Eumeta japonica]|uniref:Uncharacterized protein n=1 Tax=Eumeta variegata TaxID=151549 RepID=A0A4C1Y6A1_EUMVA|nr:hypothetical protein EVAR_51685_1 [Eumeta japonica]